MRSKTILTALFLNLPFMNYFQLSRVSHSNVNANHLDTKTSKKLFIAHKCVFMRIHIGLYCDKFVI